MCGIRESDVMFVVQFFHRIGEIDVANIEWLHRVDRMHVGVDSPGLHLQMRTAGLRDVAHPADNDVPTPVGGVECRSESVMTGIASILDIHDVAEVVVIEVICGKVKGSGGGIECNCDTVSIF